MATRLNKSSLNQLFSDGERPTGDNFQSAWMSFLNQTDDQIAYNATNNSIELGPNTGLVLGNPTRGGTAGTLRFNSGTRTIQFHDGNVFRDIAEGAGAFVPVGTGPAVAFNGGNVGIGTATTVPSHRLEIPLGDNNSAGEEILLGNLVIHNGTATDSGAYIGNTALASNPTGYALLQNSVGRTTINASNANGSQLSLAINGIDRLLITQSSDIVLTPSTSVLIRGEVNIGTRLAGRTLTINNVTTGGTGSPALTLNGDNTATPGIPALVVNGAAAKTGSLVWVAPGSDARIKKEIRPFKEGLDKIMQLNPVVYKYNGKGGIADNDGDIVGLIAQDVQKAAPEMIFSKWQKLNSEDENETELLNYDFHNVLFMFINAFKELNAKVEKLEKA